MSVVACEQRHAVQELNPIPICAQCYQIAIMDLLQRIIEQERKMQAVEKRLATVEGSDGTDQGSPDIG